MLGICSSKILRIQPQRPQRLSKMSFNFAEGIRTSLAYVRYNMPLMYTPARQLMRCIVAKTITERPCLNSVLPPLPTSWTFSAPSVWRPACTQYLLAKLRVCTGVKLFRQDGKEDHYSASRVCRPTLACKGISGPQLGKYKCKRSNLKPDGSACSQINFIPRVK